MHFLFAGWKGRQSKQTGSGLVKICCAYAELTAFALDKGIPRIRGEEVVDDVDNDGK
jgi:hypothetical protein